MLVCQLPTTFRRLPRPSSPVIAKASTTCTCSLDPITSVSRYNAYTRVSYLLLVRRALLRRSTRHHAILPIQRRTLARPLSLKGARALSRWIHFLSQIVKEPQLQSAQRALCPYHLKPFGLSPQRFRINPKTLGTDSINSLLKGHA